MKTIKECINWMLDNPMKELEDTTGNFTNARYNDIEKQFESILLTFGGSSWQKDECLFNF